VYSWVPSKSLQGVPGVVASTVLTVRTSWSLRSLPSLLVAADVTV
jgi:hypothetical protein